MVDLFKRYRRIHPGCTKKEIEDLVSAIRGDKYWNAFPNSRDALYVLALTRARIRASNKNNVVKVTHLGKILVQQDVARFCSRGKVLLVVKENSHYRARYVITWPAFVNIMRSNSELFYQALIGSETTELIGVKKAKEIMMEKCK